MGFKKNRFKNNMKKYFFIFIVVILAIGYWRFASADDTTANSPGTMADDATVGTVAWSNPDNAKVSDNVYATASVNATISHYLKATNFGFAIPTGATIDGILVEVEKKHGGGTSRNQDSAAKIVKSDGTIGTTDKKIEGNWTTTDTYYSYGGATDKWGETWTPTDINDADFGFVFSITGEAERGGAIGSVDHIRITVTYSTASSPTPQQQTRSGSMTIKSGTITIK